MKTNNLNPHAPRMKVRALVWDTLHDRGGSSSVSVFSRPGLVLGLCCARTWAQDGVDMDDVVICPVDFLIAGVLTLVLAFGAVCALLWFVGGLLA